MIKILSTYVLFIGVATCSRVYDVNRYVIQNVNLNNNYGVDRVGSERQNILRWSSTDQRLALTNVDTNGANVNKNIDRNTAKINNRSIAPNLSSQRIFKSVANGITTDDINRIRSNSYSNTRPDNRIADLSSINENNQSYLYNRNLGDTNTETRRNKNVNNQERTTVNNANIHRQSSRTEKTMRNIYGNNETTTKHNTHKHDSESKSFTDTNTARDEISTGVIARPETTQLRNLNSQPSKNGEPSEDTDAGRRCVTTDGLLSALARLRRPPPPLQHPALPSRHPDGRAQPTNIQSTRPSPEHAAGVGTDSMTVARGEESPERLGGALRRLHYRATRRAHSAAASRHHTTSKVAVMSSSTTSDKTINTSTDSAATAITSVTCTDDSMDADTDAPESQAQISLIDADPPQLETDPPSTAPPHYHRAQNSCEYDPPTYPQSATDAVDSPGPDKFIFDVPLPVPVSQEKIRNKTQVSQTCTSGPSTSIQIPFDPKLEPPKSPKINTSKYETHFKFEPEATKRRGSEPRIKNKQKLEKTEYYKEEVAKLRRQLEGTEVFTTNRRRSSTHQHSVPPPASRRQSTAAQVHVTANPLESASSIPSGRTTIVVQQPSLSLDYGGCSTILVRDGEDGRRASRVCNDHIQQLLDVTSQFTSEDLHDFDKRYGSPHHSRSQSVKAQRSRTGERQLLGLPQQRARVASMPNTGVEEEYYRLRHFSITGKGVVNRGDSLRSRRSKSNTSVASSASSTEAVTRASAPCSLASSRDSSAGLSSYRVLVLGGPGVGKSSLVGQFMTSEYLHAYDTSIDDESGEKSVCVLLAGEESEITFLDAPPDHMMSDGCAHGYCVVYSTADRTSFAEAERRLQTLWAAGHTARRAVILVGNKADLARSRLVPTDEGKALATSYECKFIETSVGINHNVDELLVGLLTQIRLKQQHAERVRKRSGSRKNRTRARSPMEPETTPAPPAPSSASSTPRKRTRLSASVKVRGLLGRVWARDSKSKSCENLHVL